MVTGHSLGAGASILIALYLRNFFRHVFCWAFSPPGGLAEPSVAEAAESFCTTVALGKDWIPRLTLGSFEHLRDEMASHCAITFMPFVYPEAGLAVHKTMISFLLGAWAVISTCVPIDLRKKGSICRTSAHVREWLVHIM